MRVFISGGCKNGKSYVAQQIARMQGDLRYYLATMRPVDDEDRLRIKRHQDERADWGFTTVECPENLASHVSGLELGASFLLDSTTALLANEMFLPDGSVSHGAHEKVAADLKALLAKTPNIVIVSDFIGGDFMEQYDPLSLAYMKSLCKLECAAAALCETVIEVVFGACVYHKGGWARGGF